MTAVAGKPQATQARTPYTPPPVSVGQIVRWYPNGNTSDGCKHVCAVVVTVGRQTINLHIFQEAPNGAFRDGVRHKGDPSNNQFDLSECGVWDHTDETRRLRALEVAIAVLVERAQETEAKVQQQGKGK